MTPNIDHIYSEAGINFYKNGMYHEAKFVFKRLIKLNPNNEEAKSFIEYIKKNWKALPKENSRKVPSWILKYMF